MNDLSFVEAERIEAAALAQMSASAPSSAAIRTARLGGGLVLTRRGLDSLTWNRATGFNRRLTRSDVEIVLAYLRQSCIPRAIFRVAPDALPPDWDHIRTQIRLTTVAAQIKWAAPIDVAVSRTRDARTELRIEQVGPADARQWAKVMCAVAGMDDAAAAAFAALTQRPGWQSFAAWEGDDIAGTGMVHVKDQIGHLMAGTVLESHRCRGAQSALIAARACAAQQMGARWITSDTSTNPNGLNTSGRNLTRSGFTPLYQRPGWLWEYSVVR